MALPQVIRTVKNFLGTKVILPRTVAKAVYDNDGNPIDEVIDDIKKDIIDFKKYNFDSPIVINDTGVFTAPCDGYAEFLINDSSGYAYYIINHLVNVRATATQGFSYGAQTIFIKKGMRIEFVSSNGDHSAKFYPLA